MIARFQTMFRHDNTTKLFAEKADNAKYGAVTGHIIGYRLDNASGDTIDEHAVIKGYQEYVLSLEVFTNNNMVNRNNHFETELFNIANLIAAIRAH